MKRCVSLLLLAAGLACAAPEPPPSRPSFTELETPWQMLGQAGGGAAGAFLGGMMGASIGASRAKKACMDRIDPDFSDECGWSSLGGAALGFAIGMPIGHALGALGVGVIQGKHGAPIAAVSAVAGDAALFFLALGLHDALDGKFLPNGGLDPALITMTLAGMVAIPVATQSIWDYRVRIALQPGVAPGASRADNRYLLRFAEVRF